MHCWEIKGKFTSLFFLFLPFMQNKITLPLNLSFTLCPGYSLWHSVWQRTTVDHFKEIYKRICRGWMDNKNRWGLRVKREKESSSTETWKWTVTAECQNSGYWARIKDKRSWRRPSSVASHSSLIYYLTTERREGSNFWPVFLDHHRLFYSN